jgi:hypothetical protein
MFSVTTRFGIGRNIVTQVASLVVPIPVMISVLNT